MKKYALEITIKSVSPDGDVHQDVTVTEYSLTANEHMMKNMRIASAVMAEFGAMASEATAANAPASASKPKRR